MLAEISQWIPFNTWLSLASIVVGVVVISPLLLSKSFRKRAEGIGSGDLEGIGLIVLVVAIVCIGLYNYLSSSAGA